MNDLIPVVVIVATTLHLSREEIASGLEAAAEAELARAHRQGWCLEVETVGVHAVEQPSPVQLALMEVMA